MVLPGGLIPFQTEVNTMLGSGRSKMKKEKEEIVLNRLVQFNVIRRYVKTNSFILLIG